LGVVISFLSISSSSASPLNGLSISNWLVLTATISKCRCASCNCRIALSSSTPRSVQRTLMHDSDLKSGSRELEIHAVIEVHDVHEV
jgi:hypothetical protein